MIYTSSAHALFEYLYTREVQLFLCEPTCMFNTDSWHNLFGRYEEITRNYFAFSPILAENMV